MARRRYVVTLLVSLLLLLTVACGGEEKDKWTHGDSENWKATCDQIAGWQQDNCDEDEESIIEALADGWSKDCAVQYYTDVWNSETEDPDPYMCEGGGAPAKPTEPSTPAYELEGTHYQEAQIELLWADYACQDVPALDSGAARNRVIYNIRNLEGGLIAVARYKDQGTGRRDMPAACLYRYSTNDLPILNSYRIELIDTFGSTNKVVKTFSATSNRFLSNYPDQGITTIAWRCEGC